jgi:hypothetical protein
MFENQDPYILTDACVERLWREYETHKRLIVAVDYDDTVFDFHKRTHLHGYILRLLRRCKEAGFYVVLFSASAPERHPEMLAYMESHGVEVDSVNRNPIPLPFGHHGKIYYNILLDDRAGLGQAAEILEEVLRRRDDNRLSSGESTGA